MSAAWVELQFKPRVRITNLEAVGTAFSELLSHSEPTQSKVLHLLENRLLFAAVDASSKTYYGRELQHHSNSTHSLKKRVTEMTAGILQAALRKFVCKSNSMKYKIGKKW
eukprot:scpid43758/ scgid18429/ 